MMHMNEFGPMMTNVQNNFNAMDENTTAIADDTYHTGKVVDLITDVMTAPIRELESAAKGMAEGSLNVDISYNSGDE